MQDTAVVADIGGTHARFGMVDRLGHLSNIAILKCAEFDGLQSAYRAYVSTHGIQSTQLAAAVACPVDRDQIDLTNNHWSFSKAALIDQLEIDNALIINDFTAQSLAVVSVPSQSFEVLQTGIVDTQAPIFVIGPGTGLGVGGLVKDASGDWVPLSTEGGHVTLAAQTEDEWAVLQRLRTHYPHVSAERVISGPGLLLLYKTLCDLEGQTALVDSPADMIHAHKLDPLIERTFALFAGFFGIVASDGCLTLGATQAVCIAGGVVPKLGEHFRRDIFMQRFQAKGRFESYLARVPVKILLDSEAGLSGLARALQTPALARFLVRSM